jgi:hypothetical protein
MGETFEDVIKKLLYFYDNKCKQQKTIAATATEMSSINNNFYPKKSGCG